MFEPVGFLRMNSEKAGKTSPEQSRHIYTKILQNSTANILSARSAKTNNKTPEEFNIFQSQKHTKIDKNLAGIPETANEKEFKSIYSSNQVSSSIDLKNLNYKNFQDHTIYNANNNNKINNSNDNSRNMRKSLENLNIYNKSKPVDKYSELKQSIMNQIKFQNFKETEEKNSSRDNSKPHSSNSNTNNNAILNHKSALNYFSLNQSNKNIKGPINNHTVSEKPPNLSTNKTFKKMTKDVLETVNSPEKKGNIKIAYNSIKKEKRILDNNNANNYPSQKEKNNVDKYYEIIEKGKQKESILKNTNFLTKDVASHSFQQNTEKPKINEILNISDNPKLASNYINFNKSSENNTNELDFTFLKSYNEKFSKIDSEKNQEFRHFFQERPKNINDNEDLELYIRENIKRNNPQNKRESAKSLPSTTKNSGSLNFKSNLNEMALNQKAYNLFKARKEDEEIQSISTYTGYLKSSTAGSLNLNQNTNTNHNVKVNDLLNDELRNNSEKLIKHEKDKCEDCEHKIEELEVIYEKVSELFEKHRKKEMAWNSEKGFYLKQIDYLNSLIKQYIQEKKT